MLRDIIDEITKGKGYFILPNAVDSDTVKFALRYVQKCTNGLNDNILERRVWDLHKRNEKFANLAYHPIVKEAYDIILGTKHKLSSFGANRLMPGCQAQEPHTDYPYWGLYDLRSLPLNINSSFTIACQTLIPLQDFSANNGATEIIPNTQLLCRYPDESEFQAKAVKLNLKAGDLLMYHSLLWHRAGINSSDEDRVCLLGQYTAYFVKDMM